MTAWARRVWRKDVENATTHRVENFLVFSVFSFLELKTFFLVFSVFGKLSNVIMFHSARKTIRYLSGMQTQTQHTYFEVWRGPLTI